jgi:hypothetical protein
MEFSIQLGRRKAHAAVRNAELQIAREKVVLAEQEREVVHDLSNAVAEKDRAFAVVQTSYNRRQAAREQLASVQAAYEADNAPINVLLDTQRNLADAESEYHRSLIEYALALKNVHFEKGTLLDYNDVYLAEGYWPAKAYQDAALRTALRSRPLPAENAKANTPAVTEGPMPQLILPQPEAQPQPLTVPPPAPPVNSTGSDLPPAIGELPRTESAGDEPIRAIHEGAADGRIEPVSGNPGADDIPYLESGDGPGVKNETPAGSESPAELPPAPVESP